MERYRFYNDGAVYFVTFSVVKWLPVFVSEQAFQIITNCLAFCDANHGLRVNAFVIMPTHFHGILFHESFAANKLEAAVTNFRKFTGRQLADYCDRQLPACFAETFRAAAGDDRQRRFWQTSRHAVQIETESFWSSKFDYIHQNPCRKGLVRRAVEWRFSSAGFWQSDGTGDSDVPLTALEW